MSRGKHGWTWGGGMRALAAIAAAGLFSLASADAALAQGTGSIRGTITDAATLQPVAGAQVVVVGTQLGGLTDVNGVYVIADVPVGAATVQVQNIGYKQVEQQVQVTADAAVTADFALEQAAINLDAIVVTGTAGAATKRTLGNTVSTINAAAITETRPVNDVQELLQARTPGLTLMSSSGQAGASSKIRIRGAGSLTADLDPVFFVDGVRVASGTNGGFGVNGGTVQGTNPLDAINPKDIESIEVIKGPAAATLYGAEAAGGVIQIITKKGRPSSGIQWNAGIEAGQDEWVLDQPTTYWLCTPTNISDPDTYPGCAGMDPNAPAASRLLIDHPLDPNGRSTAVQKELAAMGLPTNEYACVYTPDCTATPLRSGDILNYNLSARGGGENYNFYISGEKSDEQGVYFNNFSRRTSGRANFGFVPSQKLNFNVNLAYSRNQVKMPLQDNSSNSVLRNAMRGRAGAASDPWLPGFKSFSPEISNAYDNRNFWERTTIGMTANYTPFSWWQNKLTVGMDKDDRKNTEFYRLDETGRAPWGDVEATGAIYNFMPVRHIWTVDYSGTVSTDLSDNYSSAFSAGMQLTKRHTETQSTDGEGLVANNLNLVSSAAVTRGGQGVSEQTSLGFYVQEMVGFKDKLYATAAVRVDDNSAFGKDFSLVVYPKASLAYVISDEDFFNVPFVSQLKLRGAWGEAGRSPAPFSADRTLEPAITTVGDVAVNQLQTSSYGNPDLKAETGSELELGFDGALFDGKVGVEFTYYNQHTRDALLEVPDPRSSGFSDDHLVNIGEIANSGFELMLTATPVARPNFSWDVAVSASTNHNELVSFGRLPDGSPVLKEDKFGAFASVQRHREGYPLGGFWAVDVLRDANGNPILDADGDVTVDDFCDWPNECHEEFVGPMLPTRQVGLSNTFTLFNNIRLGAQVDYKGGNYQWCAICSIRNRIDRNTFEVNDPNADPVRVAVLHSLQTKEWIYPADFIKLRELALTFTLPTSLASRFRADRLSLTLAGRNLWMWTKYKGTSDPEVSFYSSSNFTQLDYAATPMTRRLLLSMNVAF